MIDYKNSNLIYNCMKYIKKYEEWDYSKLHTNKSFTLYHGTNHTPFQLNPIFLTIDKDFASDYGENIYEVVIEPKNIFDSFDPDNWKWLFSQLKGAPIEDSYNQIEYYSFDEMEENYPDWESDTWEMIEDNLFLLHDYDSVLISEGGTVNFIVLDKSIIKKHKLIKTINESINIKDYFLNKFDKDKMKKGLSDFKEKIIEEKDDYKDVAKILKKYSKTGSITNDEAKIIKEQFYDTLKMVGLGGVFVLPGGAVGIVILLKISKKLGINLLPSAWSNEK